MRTRFLRGAKLNKADNTVTSWAVGTTLNDKIKKHRH